ncbi:MAG: DUF669 domain-containing protein [Peptostreptococcaceae bacterium]|nr:DUF669 domain-containing protein [Peptostreptococcaceae bacterium]
MAVFKMDTNDTYQGGVKPKGYYEVEIDNAYEEASKTGGNSYVRIVLRVREDVEQAYKKALIFVNLYRSRETGEFNFRIFNSIGKACGMENGKEYNTLSELLDDFRGRSCKIKLGHNEYNERTYERVDEWKSSDFPKERNLIKASGFDEVSIEDEDIPF